MKMAAVAHLVRRYRTAGATFFPIHFIRVIFYPNCIYLENPIVKTIASPGFNRMISFNIILYYPMICLRLSGETKSNPVRKLFFLTHNYPKMNMTTKRIFLNRIVSQPNFVVI